MGQTMCYLFVYLCEACAPGLIYLWAAGKVSCDDVGSGLFESVRSDYFTIQGSLGRSQPPKLSHMFEMNASLVSSYTQNFR